VIDDETGYPQHGRTQLRSLFPADYLYSFSRIDDFAHVFAGEAAHFDRGDEEAVRPRITDILAKTPNATAGGTTFSQLCAGCHGAAGQGGGFAPSLVERVPMREDESILQTLIAGKGGMPAWGERLNDQQLADLLAHLRARFGKPPE